MHPTQHMGQQQQRQQPPPQQQQGMPPHNMMQMSPRTQVLAPLRCRTRSALCAASSSSRSPRCAHPACVLFSGAAAISAPTVADDVAGQCLPNFCFFGVCGGPLGADVLCVSLSPALFLSLCVCVFCVQQQHPSQHPQSQPHMQGMQPQQHPGQPQQQVCGCLCVGLGVGVCVWVCSSPPLPLSCARPLSRARRLCCWPRILTPMLAVKQAPPQQQPLPQQQQQVRPRLGICGTEIAARAAMCGTEIAYGGRCRRSTSSSQGTSRYSAPP